MKQDMTLEDYAAYRKAYLQKAREDFHLDRQGCEESDDTPAEEDYFFFTKIRLVAAMLLFIGFLYCWYTKTPIFGHSAKEVISIVEDDHYFTMLKDYIEVKEEP